MLQLFFYLCTIFIIWNCIVHIRRHSGAIILTSKSPVYPAFSRLTVSCLLESCCTIIECIDCSTASWIDPFVGNGVTKTPFPLKADENSYIPSIGRILSQNAYVRSARPHSTKHWSRGLLVAFLVFSSVTSMALSSLFCTSLRQPWMGASYRYLNYPSLLWVAAIESQLPGVWHQFDGSRQSRSPWDGISM